MSRGDDNRMCESCQRRHDWLVRWEMFEAPTVLLIEVNG
jgi:hypothetical protein